jgi:hypothetical protein
VLLFAYEKPANLWGVQRISNMYILMHTAPPPPLGLIKQGNENQYDKEKYLDMLLATAETVLGYFGFDRLLLEIPLKRETGSDGTHLMRRGIETSRMRKRKTHHAVLITTMIGVIR